MLKNYLKIAFRNIVRHKGYSFINIAGLAVGMACCILILLWVQDELSYDKFHKNADNLYRVTKEYRYPSGKISYSRVTCPPLANVLKTEYPEIFNATRFRYRWWLMKHDEKAFIEMGALVDPSFLEMFTFLLLKGNIATVLSDPYSIVLTEEMAEKYFGDEEPIGKSIIVENKFSVKVSGVMKNIPDNSHLQFSFLIPFEILRKEFSYTFEEWDTNNHYTYAMLHKNVSIQKVNQKISDIIKKHIPESIATLNLQPLTKIHLYDRDSYYIAGSGSIRYVYIFSIIAIFVLIIACINFMNLATARSSNRAKEVGMRKVVGAHRSNLIKQFLGESILLSFIALIFAITLVELFLPAFNTLSGKQLVLDFSSSISIVLGIMIITLITGIISGSYPAFFLSSIQPVKIFIGSRAGSRYHSARLRKLLVVIQFSLSIFLVIFTIVVYKQVNYMRNRDLGYNKENIVWLEMTYDFSDRYESVKTELLQDPNIISITATDSPPTYRETTSNSLDWEGKKAEEIITMQVQSVDYDYLKTFNIKLAQGRFFSKEYSTDTSNYVVNESAAKAMGMESPLGKRFSYEGREGNIIGVVKDFHSTSLRYEIEPLVMTIIPGWYDNIIIKIKSEDIPKTILLIERKIKKIVPDFPFTYFFLDESLDDLYKSEQRMGSIFRYFALLAIFISCLGLFGLASFTTEQRTKEIGIRKVLGATVGNILLLLTKDFIKWVLIANIIAWPIGYFAMNKWLQDFAYRTNIGLFTFIISALLALMIALLTVSCQAVKVALANPIEALRYE
jgi:putative ABC transport system permease protein